MEAAAAGGWYAGDQTGPAPAHHSRRATLCRHLLVLASATNGKARITVLCQSSVVRCSDLHAGRKAKTPGVSGNRGLRTCGSCEIEAAPFVTLPSYTILYRLTCMPRAFRLLLPLVLILVSAIFLPLYFRHLGDSAIDVSQIRFHHSPEPIIAMSKTIDTNELAKHKSGKCSELEVIHSICSFLLISV